MFPKTLWKPACKCSQPSVTGPGRQGTRGGAESLNFLRCSSGAVPKKAKAKLGRGLAGTGWLGSAGVLA